MTADELDLKVGHIYRPRKGSRSPEREIIWISPDGKTVQYDGPAVHMGSRYPTIPTEKFAKWAGITR